MCLYVDAKFLMDKERRARNENSEPIRKVAEESQEKFATRLQMGHCIFPFLFLM
jgi:hypothetical protein